ncbi:hypothetical protein D9M71_534730 [compost metagenome]
MRIVDGLAFGVVLAVDGCPLAGVLRRGQPQPETEKVLEPGVEFQRAVGGITVQVNGDTDDGHMRHYQGNCQQLPH